MNKRAQEYKSQKHKSTSRKSELLVRLCTFALVLLLAGCAANPITGEDEMMFSRDYHSDIEMGKQVAPDVEKEMKGKIEDEALQNYIDGVGRQISKISHNPDFDYHFVAVNDKSINAISLPGGRIFITKGMLLKLENESQLAGVLAHEIVHVVARDTQNMMSKEAGLGVLFIAAMSQARNSGEMVAMDLARQVVEMKYSRQDEQTADLGGLDYMVRAGYDPNGMIETMKMLKREDTIKPVEFFSTHPSPENRLLFIQAKIQTYYSAGLTNAKIGTEDYRRNVLNRLQNLPDTPERKP
jgi:predicted Zn-dependent protease